MDDTNPAYSFASTLTHVITSIWSLPWARSAGFLASSLLLPLRILWIPFSYLLGIFQAVLAPAGYVLSYLGSWVTSIAGFLISLQPLYTFFSVAAFIGVIAGIIMAIASAIVTTYFNMHDDDQDQHASRLAYQKNRSLESQYLKEQYLKDQYLSADDKTQPLGLEPDWHWADPSSLSSKSARFRRISSLQAQTIHEEEDDDSEQ